MIQIGHKICVIDNLKEGYHGNTPTDQTYVYFDGALVPGVNYLEIKYDSDKGLGKKICSIYVTKEEQTDLLELFASELTQHGFHVELTYLCSNYRHVEFYKVGGDNIKSVKIPIVTQK